MLSGSIPPTDLLFPLIIVWLILLVFMFAIGVVFNVDRKILKQFQ